MYGHIDPAIIPEKRGAVGIGASVVPVGGLEWLHADTTGQRFSAFDKRKLPGNTFEVSRLAMGTGVRGRSYYKRNGPKKLIELIRHGTERGLNFWDTADAYGSHPVYREVLKYEDRDKVEPSLKFVLGQGFVNNFTIGFENIAEMDDMIEKIAATRV